MTAIDFRIGLIFITEGDFMKKALRPLALLLATAVVAVLFLACVPEQKVPENAIIISVSGTDEQTVTFKEYKNFELITNQSHVFSPRIENLGALLDALAEKEGLNIKKTGGFLDELGTYVPNFANNEFITIFSTINNATYSNMVATAVVADVTYFEAMRGMDEMPALDGHSFLLFITTW
jgi:hypothetical protein